MNPFVFFVERFVRVSGVVLNHAVFDKVCLGERQRNFFFELTLRG